MRGRYLEDLLTGQTTLAAVAQGEAVTTRLLLPGHWGHGARRSLAPLCEVQLLLPAAVPAVQYSGMMRAEVPRGCREVRLK